ncbi:MAG TPA: glycosyltransferase [Ktedonobacterales bacterium]
MTVVSLVAAGTRGDVEPYIALGKGLQAAGYDARLVASDDFATLVDNAGLQFASLGLGAQARLQSPEWRQAMEQGNFLTILSKMRAEMKQSASEQAQALPPLVKGSDLILAGMTGLTGVFSIAEALHIPVMQAQVVPFTPTYAFPSPLVPSLPLGSALNRLSFHITRQLFWQSFKVSDIATRQLLGLPKGSFWGPYRALARQHVPVLYGYSTHVLPRPRDWPAEHQVTGYWFLDPPPDWMPPADLVRFLEEGPAPVYVGFGSMGSQHPAETAQLVLDALSQSGQRGVLASGWGGWGGLNAADLPHNVHLIESIPHSWLFERMAAVVHHGGAGTTAAGLRAGVPSILVPYSADQPFWGKRVAELEVGPTPIPRKRLTSQRLAEAIREAVTNRAMREQARSLGQQVRREDGIGAAVALIDDFVRRL